MEQEKKETQEQAPLKMEATRQAFLDNFDEMHPQEGEPVAFTQKDSSESDTGESAVTETHSDSSSVKEEVKAERSEKGGTKQPEEQEAKASELIQNKEKALHEEREKRKQANLKLRELQRQYEEEKRIRDEKLAALERRLEQAVGTKQQESTETSDDDSVQRELQELRAAQRKEQELRKQAEIAEQQKKLLEQINATDKALKDEGFPGFRWAVNEVDGVLKTLIEEGEYTEEDYLDPAVWKEVYKTRIYEKVASEFKPLVKKEIIDAKTERKKAVSKAAVYPGAKPTMDVDDDEEIETDSVQDYLKFKNQSAPRRNV